MVFKVQILGCGSAMPVLHRNPTAQYVNVLERHILIDCGEGTQLQFQKLRIKPIRIEHVLISHLHGDHYLGLLGFLSSMHLLGRTKKINIYGPKELKDILFSQIKASKTYLNYDIHFVALEQNHSECIFEDDSIEIFTIPLKHRVYCNGFLIREKEKPKRINKAVLGQYPIPIAWIHRVIKGEDWIREDGSIVKNKELTLPPLPLRSYAFCSDTIYTESIVPIVSNATVMYHESTFLQDLESRAKQTFHSTAKQAALIAQKANVKLLLLGHYSARYDNIKAFELEAKEYFENVIAIDDGSIIDVI